MSAFGCHAQTTAAIKALKAEIAQLRSGLQRSIALPTATEAARNVALEEEVDRLRAELDALKSAPVLSVPERLSFRNCDETEQYIRGWNDCIDMITAAKEES